MNHIKRIRNRNIYDCFVQIKQNLQHFFQYRLWSAKQICTNRNWHNHVNNNVAICCIVLYCDTLYQCILSYQISLMSLCLISAENLKATLSPKTLSPSSLSPHSDTDQVLLSSPLTPDLCEPQSSPDHSEPPQQSQMNDLDVKVPLSFYFHTKFQLLRLCERPSGD